MLVGNADEESGWKSAYEDVSTFSEDVNASARRLKVKKPGGNSDSSELGGTKHKVDGGWYFHALESTMASLGIWPFGTSKPHTEVER